MIRYITCGLMLVFNSTSSMVTPIGNKAFSFSTMRRFLVSGLTNSITASLGDGQKTKMFIDVASAATTFGRIIINKQNLEKDGHFALRRINEEARKLKDDPFLNRYFYNERTDMLTKLSNGWSEVFFKLDGYKKSCKKVSYFGAGLVILLPLCRIRMPLTTAVFLSKIPNISSEFQLEYAIGAANTMVKESQELRKRLHNRLEDRAEYMDKVVREHAAEYAAEQWSKSLID